MDFLALVSSTSGLDLDRDYIGTILGRHWGYWYSAKRFLQACHNYAQQEGLQAEARRVDQVLLLVRDVPKALGWKIRSLFGTLLPWHAHVEALTKAERQLDEEVTAP